MKLNDLVAAMEEIAPTRYAEAWDNVGLLVGDREQRLGKVLLTIDYTEAVAAEGKKLGCDGVVAYHPPIFQGMKRVQSGGVIHDAIRRGVGIYSPHTAWDVAEGGTNDFLAGVMGMEQVRALKPAEGKATWCKLVVFVPAGRVEVVSQAMFEAGAGKIGNYSECSFRSSGVGTFKGGAGAKPAIGVVGRLEKVEEVRLETVVMLTQVDQVVAAMRRAHPYEMPAFDLVKLEAVPEGKGIGRIGMLREAITRDQLCRRLKKGLQLSHLLLAGKNTGRIRKVAVCAGAGGELLDWAIKEKADVYATGELRHHDVLKAKQSGMDVICTLHSNSERASLHVLARRLRGKLPGVKLLVSKVDQDPFRVI
ncbi:MAG TPA: Nif3-like dinuclear metal center hexameric protein [Tepidisphaeraceae bacterium]|nr:Nif3-like dinuclear metal center hexameric protein [Tepidisphaeraceae bacterium]